MGDHGEVGEVALYTGIQYGLGTGVTEGGPVLVQQVHQLLRDEPGVETEGGEFHATE